MSNLQRIGILLAAVLVLGVAFVVLSDDDDGGDVTADTVPAEVQPSTTPEDATATEPGDEPATTAPEPEPEPEPEFTTIRIRDGQPVGDVEQIEVTSGERVRLEFDSNVTEEIHIHGYDRYVDLVPGEPARDSFEADAEGVFEIELHGSGALVAELVVEPS